MYYAVSAVTLYDGREFPHIFLIQAANDAEADNAAEAMLRNWWDDVEMRSEDYRYYFYGDTYALWAKGMTRLSDATAKELLENNLAEVLYAPELDFCQVNDLCDYVCAHGKKYASREEAPLLPEDAERFEADSDGVCRVLLHEGWPVAVEEQYDKELTVWVM